MQHLVEDLLAFVTLEDNPEPPSLTPMPMQYMMPQLQRDIEALSAGRHTVSTTCGPAVDVCGAEFELLSAFSNLTSNVARYISDGGSTQLDWGVRDGHAMYSATGTEIRIVPKHTPRLTKHFYRVDHNRSRDIGGTGLGLAIVEHILSRHGGEPQVTSKHGKDSTFRAVLPPERTIMHNTTMTDGRIV